MNKGNNKLNSTKRNIYFFFVRQFIALKNLFLKRRENIVLFILSPPFSGSTLLNQILSTSSNISCNNNIGLREGQHLPIVNKIMFHDERWNIPKMQEQGVMERASSLLAFYNVPKGFLHRNVVPISKKTKIIKDYCLIPHLSNRFTHVEVSSFGRIKVKDLFI